MQPEQRTVCVCMSISLAPWDQNLGELWEDLPGSSEVVSPAALNDETGQAGGRRKVLW